MEKESLDIGERIRSLRTQKNYSLSDVSKKTGLSRSFLSQLERGITSLSIDSLRSIASALSVPTSSLVDHFESKSEIVKKDERRILFDDTSGICYTLLSPDIQREVMMLLTELEPFKSSASKPFSHPGEECALVLQGRVQIEFEDHDVSLDEGDSIQIAGNIPHRIINIGDKLAIIVSALGAPGF